MTNFNTKLEVKEPKPEIELVNHDGNAFAIMGTVSKALSESGHNKDYIDAVLAEMKSDDYEHLLEVALDVCIVDI